MQWADDVVVDASEQFLRRVHGGHDLSELALIKSEVPDDEAQP
jgi:hypothetical protein